MSFPAGSGPGRNRFTEQGAGSGVESGFREASGQKDPLDKKFIARNLKPYKTLKPYGTVKGLKGLKNKNMAQLEQMSANAVLAKNHIKSKPLDTTVDRSKFKGGTLAKARRRLGGISDSWRQGSTEGIKNQKVRRAANHLRQIRRNRMVNKTRVGSPNAYDIYKGYRRR